MTSRQTTDAPAFGVAPPGHRLPTDTRIGRVRLAVADLPRSIDFYTAVLGFAVLAEDEGRATLGVADDGDPLIELHEQRGARPVPRTGRLGLFHIAILLPDRAALGRFLEHLLTLGVRPGMSDHLVSEAIYLSDPDGLGLEIYADRPRASWRANAHELSMATLPLDANALRAAAGGTPWTKAPSGTRIGHVHLHVGDLVAAEAHYHRGLGFDKVVWSYPGALFLSAGGYHHHLGTNTWAPRASAAAAGDARLLEWELMLPSIGDVDAIAAQLERGGATIAHDGADVTVRDPWGTSLRLRAAPRARESDE